MTVTCPYCGVPAVLVGGQVIYPQRSDLNDRMFWICAPCHAWVGTHKDSKDHAPLGRLANQELRTLKQQCHALFDPLWKSGRFKRKALYERLAERLGIPVKKCHFGYFDEERCRQAIDIMRPHRRQEAS